MNNPLLSDEQTQFLESARRCWDDAVEIGRLMQGFAGELRKVDEGLRILCAYAERMQRRADRSTRNLH